MNQCPIVKSIVLSFIWYYCTRESVGPVTFLVNNAGIMPAKPFLNFKAEDVESIFKVNVFSQFWTLFEFLPSMILSDHGHVVCMSSTGRDRGGRHSSPSIAPPSLPTRA